MANKFEEGKVLDKEKLDKLRDIEGFPLGQDEDIIGISTPPYYTACPNPFINDFIDEFGRPYDEETDDYHREPFASDVSEGKNDPIYMAHTYHTKVPHKAIMRYILHYTEPGDIVFDGFCGSGMTGVAAQMCGTPDSDLEFKHQIDKEMPNIKWGARKAILNDLSPAATFIAHNYNTPMDADEFEKEANRILDECEKELSWMYETSHLDEERNEVYDIAGIVKGKVNYTIWSDVFVCPNCNNEIVFWEAAVDEQKKKLRRIFKCNNCKIELKKTDCARATELVYDEGLNDTINMAKQVPVLINYSVNRKRFEKKPDKEDLNLIEKINNTKIPYWYPTDEMPDGYNTSQPKKSHGTTHVHQFYTKRNLFIFSKVINLANKSKFKNKILFLCTSVLTKTGSKLHNIGFKNGKINLAGAMPNTLYIPSNIAERNIFELLRGKINDIKKIYYNQHSSILNLLSTNSLTNIIVPTNSVDYIFTDPPFGANLNYSELSFIWEAWIKIITNNDSEAIVNNVQQKGISEYQNLMTRCFEEYYRILKPNRWITVEFHNSKNAVWNSIQESLLKAGFIIADVRTLDKKQGTFMQMTSKASVKQDLVISAYKPKESFKNRFLKNEGSEESVWDFINAHLEKLPIVVAGNDKVEVLPERQGYLLFDRMVAYHIMQGVAIPIDADEFYKKLDEKYIQRDNMYFLLNQVNEYDNARIKFELMDIQFNIFVDDERSAIAWLYYQLENPQTYSEIHPKFTKEAKPARHEDMPELLELLQENFLQDEEGKWYIPDITKAGDIQKLREKKLLKEFEEYSKTKGKLKAFRTEAIRAGFAKLWKEKNYELIVKMGDRIPEKVLQEDDKLLMYYDISSSRID